MIAFTIPIKLESLANKREHWAQKAHRAKLQRNAAYMSGYAAASRKNRGRLAVIGDGLRVTITRIAPRALDTDNLAISGKHVRDGIADALGINDNDPRVSWVYAQEKGKPREYAVRVEME